MVQNFLIFHRISLSFQNLKINVVNQKTGKTYHSYSEQQGHLHVLVDQALQHLEVLLEVLHQALRHLEVPATNQLRFGEDPALRHLEVLEYQKNIKIEIQECFKRCELHLHLLNAEMI